MDMTRKQEILTYLNELSRQFDSAVNTVPEILKSHADGWFTGLDKTSGFVDHCSLYVPVVGGFSAGKSAALNALVGRDILPEKVTPETAIPAELHFSDDERISAQAQNGDWSTHAITALPELSENAKDYQVVRIYLNSPVLKDIEPLVLVDMPGFDSGLDQHNQAILRYITTGAMYLYLVDCKAGTVSRQDSRRIEEILDLGRRVEVLMTKTDLASEIEVNAARDHVADHLSMIMESASVGLINKSDVSAMLSRLKAANVSALFDAMTIPGVKDLFFDADGLVNTAISSLTSDAASLEKKIEEAASTLRKVEAEKQRLLDDAKSSGVSEKCELVISRLDQALRSSTDELVAQAKVSEAALSRGVADLVRSTLTVEIQAVVRKSTSDIAFQFSDEINIGSLSLGGEGWLENMVGVLESEVMNALAGLQDATTGQKAGAHYTHDADKNPLGKAINAISGFAIMIPNPVLRVVFALLPGIIGQLFGSFKSNAENDRYREAISSQVIPTVISQVRPQVMDSLQRSESEIIRVVSEQISEKVSAQKSLYDEVAKRSESEISALQSKQQDLEKIKNEMKTKAKAKGVFADVN